MNNNDNNKENLTELLSNISEIEVYLDFIKSLDLSNVYELDNVLREYPARKARFIFAYELQTSKVLKLEQKIKETYYEIYKELKLQKKTLNLTEEGIKSFIYTDERYRRLMEEFLEEKKKLGIIKGAKDALDDLGRMLYALVNVNVTKY